MSRAILLLTAAILIAAAFAIATDWQKADSFSRAAWQQAAVPGDLSRSHAFLSNNCAACHAPVKGVDAKLCIACHADNTALLQRQPTAFHAQIQICSGCHVEHQAGTRMPTTMDHTLLAQVGHRELGADRPSGLEPETAIALLDWLPQREARVGEQKECDGSAGCTEAWTTIPPSAALGLPATHPRSGDESMLNCVSCHATKDRHQGFLGTECMQCHATTQWTIAEFRHPSSRSTECVQCHKPPPSHNMMHFSMMSAQIARRPKATVNQCFLCHQTTSWNDIKGVGLVKHH